jgi:hypothetical protein
VKPGWVRGLGLLLALLYGAFIVHVYARQPRTLAQVAGGVAARLGVYEVDRASFDEGLRYFHADRFPEARAALERADPARQDARTQFYVAYSYLREGWGRLYSDDVLYAKGLEAVERARAVAPGGRVEVQDAALTLRTADELEAELERGLKDEPSDLNPLKVFRKRP